MIVVVPSRGRPDNIRRLIKAWAETATADTELRVIVDADDPDLPGYRDLPVAAYWTLHVQDQHRGLGPVLNAAAMDVSSDTPIVGNAGDDHLPITAGWDSRIIETLTGPGVAYGDDLLQGQLLPTAAFVTSDLVRCLGFYCPPSMMHLYIDNFWMHLGRSTSLHYLPDVIIEHLHPHAGKAPSDAGYESANSAASIDADSRAWQAYVVNDWPADLDKLRAAGLAASPSQ